jgi:hypothetical protein
MHEQAIFTQVVVLILSQDEAWAQKIHLISLRHAPAWAAKEHMARGRYGFGQAA